MTYGYITDLCTGFEYGYSDTTTREFIIADIVADGHTYRDTPVYVY